MASRRLVRMITNQNKLEGMFGLSDGVEIVALFWDSWGARKTMELKVTRAASMAKILKSTGGTMCIMEVLILLRTFSSKQLQSQESKDWAVVNNKHTGSTKQRSVKFLFLLSGAPKFWSVSSLIALLNLGTSRWISTKMSHYLSLPLHPVAVTVLLPLLHTFISPAFLAICTLFIWQVWESPRHL